MFDEDARLTSQFEMSFAGGGVGPVGPESLIYGSHCNMDAGWSGRGRKSAAIDAPDGGVTFFPVPRSERSALEFSEGEEVDPFVGRGATPGPSRGGRGVVSTARQRAFGSSPVPAFRIQLRVVEAWRGALIMKRPQVCCGEFLNVGEG